MGGTSAIEMTREKRKKKAERKTKIKEAVKRWRASGPGKAAAKRKMEGKWYNKVKRKLVGLADAGSAATTDRLFKK